jgi:hypothetical protein
VGEVFTDREVNVSGSVESGSGISHLPSHLVETTPETIKEFTDFHSHDGFKGFHLESLDVASVISVILSDDGVRFFHMGISMPIKSVKVKLCPFGFNYEIPRGPWNHFSAPR